MRGGAEAARKAHNLEVGGSNPSPATRRKRTASLKLQLFIQLIVMMRVHACHRSLARGYPKKTCSLLSLE